jgi:ketosteroid isomerase-like protein
MSWVLAAAFALVALYLAFLLLKQKGPKHQKETEEVKKIVFSLNGAYRAKELKVITSALSDDFTAFLDSPYRLDSKASFVSLLENFFDQATLDERTVLQEKFVAWDGGWVLATYHFIEKGKIAEKPFERTGKASELYRSTPLGWKAVHFHYTYLPSKDIGIISSRI